MDTPTYLVSRYMAWWNLTIIFLFYQVCSPKPWIFAQWQTLFHAYTRKCGHQGKILSERSTCWLPIFVSPMLRLTVLGRMYGWSDLFNYCLWIFILAHPFVNYCGIIFQFYVSYLIHVIQVLTILIFVLSTGTYQVIIIILLCRVTYLTWGSSGDLG